MGEDGGWVVVLPLNDTAYEREVEASSDSDGSDRLCVTDACCNVS